MFMKPPTRQRSENDQPKTYESEYPTQATTPI